MTSFFTSEEPSARDFLPSRSSYNAGQRFVGPMLKIRRAATHYKDLENALLTEQLSIAKLAPALPNDFSGFLMLGGHKLDWQIPLIIGDIVHNLRSSLDLAVGDFIRTTSDPTAVRGHLPFSNDLIGLKKEVKRNFSHLGAEVCDLIFMLEPYRSGNKPLWDLHQLDLVDKHRIVLPSFGIPMPYVPSNPFLWSGLSSCPWALNLCFENAEGAVQPLMPSLHDFFREARKAVRVIAEACGQIDTCTANDVDIPGSE